jgi:hypothetical protein
MLNTIFWVFFATGTLLAALVAFFYSRKGIHPRFHPNRGIVAMVFIILMVGNVFVSLFAAKIVGPPKPPLPSLRERNSAQSKNEADLEKNASPKPSKTEAPMEPAYPRSEKEASDAGTR